MENAGLLLPTESFFFVHPIFDLVQPKSALSRDGDSVFFDLVSYLVDDRGESNDCPRFSCLLVRLDFVGISSSLESSEDDSSSDDSDCLFFEMVALGLIFLFVSLISSTESDDAERFLPDVFDFFLLFTELADMELSDEDDDEEGEDGKSSFLLETFSIEHCFFSLLLW